MTGMLLRNVNKGFEFSSDASLAFVGNDFLGAHAEITKLALQSKRINANLQRLAATVKSTNPQDTTRIVDVECKVELNQLKGRMGDSLAVFCKQTKATVHLQPGDKNPAKPKIGLSLEADTLFARAGGIRLGMDKAGFGVSAEKLRDSLWMPKGIIGFNRLKVSAPPTGYARPHAQDLAHCRKPGYNLAQCQLPYRAFRPHGKRSGLRFVWRAEASPSVAGKA